MKKPSLPSFVVPLEVAWLTCVGVVADDLAEFDAAEEVLIGLGDLTEDGVRAHVLDVGLDERSALLDGLDDFLLASDGLVDEGVLPGGQLARGQDVLLRLFLAEWAGS